MTQGALHFDALLSVNNFDQGITRIKNGIREASGLAVKEAQVMDSAFKNLGTAIGGYLSAQGIMSFTKELINVRGEFQKTEIAFTTMLGSADKAKQLMSQMVKLAAETPFGLQDVSQGAKQLLAFQVPAKEVVDTLTRLGNIAAGVSVPIDRIVGAFGKVKATGTLQGDEMNIFMEAGIPIMSELAKVTGHADDEIKKLVSQGKIGFNDVKNALFGLTNEGGMFFNLMEKQSASLSGKVANLGDAWDQMLNKIGEGNEGFLYGSIEQLTMLVERYDAVIDAVQTIVLSYGAYKAAIIVTAAAQSMANKTLATEIGLLSFSQRMKLGRAIVTQRQTAATLAEAQAEKASLTTKYATLQAEISSLAVKKQKAVALAMEKAQALGNAQVQLSLARAELAAVTSNGTAREVLIATKNVEKAQNAVIAAQEDAEITRKASLTAGAKFYNAQKEIQVVATNLNIASTNVETAAEVANSAAKTANAIATQRLTIAQTLQTVAMTAAARAAAFLNATLFANPYALATALIVALAFAVYKYNTALTVAEESQKRMNDDAKTQIAGITEQEARIKALIKVLGDEKVAEDKKASALKQLHTLSNGRLDQLDAEAVKTGKSTEMIKKYIEMLKLEAEAKRYVNELGRLDSDIEDLKNNKKNFGFGDWWDDITDFDSSFQWSLGKRKEERVDRIVKDKEAEKKLLQTKLDNLAKKGVNISETEINETKSPKKIGILERLNEELKAANEAIQKAGSDSEIAKWIKVRDKIQAKIDSYGVKKKKPKEERQLAEIFPFGTPKQIQQQIQLLQEAMDLVDKGMVKIRKLDKYGNDKDKKGNPYFTGEIISLEEAGKRREKLEEQYNALAYKNFQERSNEAERQWNNYYKMVEFYGKESADAQYKNMFGGVQSYFEYLTKQQLALWDKRDKGILSEQEKKDIIFIEEKLRDLSGEETPLENFKKSVQDSLKSMPSLVDQIDYINNAIEKNRTSSQSNSPDFFGKNKFLEEQKRNVLQQQKDTYETFVQEQQKFEDKKLSIQQKYENIRKQLGENSTKYTEKQLLDLLDKSYKAESKEVANAALENLQKNELWVKAFEDLGKVGPKTLLRLKKSLQDIIETNKNLSFSDLKVLQDQIIKIDEVTKKRNPFEAIGIAVEKYSKKRQELTKIEKESGKSSDQYKEKLEETKITFAELIETSGVAVIGSLQFASSLGDAFGILSEEAQKTLQDIEQLAEGVTNTVTGYIKKDYGQMLSGIIQMVGSLTKMLNGDDDRDFMIRSWARSINDLKSAYEQLNREIAKTAGNAQFDKQRELIKNLEEQKAAVQRQLALEQDKKKPDADKKNEYKNQIADINGQIEDLIDGITEKIAGTNFKDLASQLADALTQAFEKGEDAALSYEKIVSDVMRKSVQEALKVSILEPATKNIVDSIVSSLGYGSANSALAEKQILDAHKLLKSYEDEQLDVLYKDGQYSYRFKELDQLIKDLKTKIDILKTKSNTSQLDGAFDGLTNEEREYVKSQGESAMKQYMEALKQYQDLFAQSAENAQGIKGDIKGVTEKTAGALEGQINAARIMIAQMLKIHQTNQELFKSQLNVLSQIEANTRHLIQMRKDLAEMNSKIKPGLAGIP